MTRITEKDGMEMTKITESDGMETTGVPENDRVETTGVPENDRMGKATETTATGGPDAPRGPTIVPPTGGETFDFGGLGVEWKIDGDHSDGRFAVVHHPIAPRALAAPLHYHHNEDEYSYVLSGTLGALLGDDVVEAGPGTWVHKPRGQWHTFWNAGDTPCHIIEVISPAGFEDYFREAAEAWGDMEAFGRICEKYSLDIDVESVPALCERFGLTFPEL